jgi:thymidine phosphorylase
VDAHRIGLAAWRLGAGRARKEDSVSAPAGVLLRCRPGDRVSAGDPLYELHAEEAGRIPDALAVARTAVGIADSPPADRDLVLERVV